MPTQEKGAFANAIATVVGAGTALQIPIAFLVVVPLTLWLAWSHHARIAESTALTLFCLSSAWLNISILGCHRSRRKLGLGSRGRLGFGLGPRPEDSDEMRLWQWGIQFRYSFLAVVLSMAAFATTKWLNGE
jgi:hypothetical protein